MRGGKTNYMNNYFKKKGGPTFLLFLLKEWKVGKILHLRNAFEKDLFREGPKTILIIIGGRLDRFQIGCPL